MQKRLTVILSVFSFGLASVNSFILLPLNISMSNNIIYQLSAFPLILSFLSTLTELLVFWIALAVLVYAISTIGFRSCRSLMIIYGASIFYKHAVNLIIDSVTKGEFISSLLGSTAFNVFIELAIAAFAILFTRRFITVNAGLAIKERVALFPFERLFDLDNPVQKSAFVASLAITVPRIFSRIIYDIVIGLPSDLKDALWMVAYYLLDVVTGVIGYLIMILLIMSFRQKQEVLEEFDKTTV